MCLGQLLTAVFTKRVGHLVAHHHGNLVIGELEFVHDAGEKSNLAPGHAEGVDLIVLEDGYFPIPLWGAGIPCIGIRLEAIGNRIESHHCGVARGQQGVLLLCLALHGLELFGGRALELLRRNELANVRGTLDHHAIAWACEGL